MSKISKCFWCKGKSNKGVHDKCWQIFKGFMLSDRKQADNQLTDGEQHDEYMPTGQDYTDYKGHNVVQGRVMPAATEWPEFKE